MSKSARNLLFFTLAILLLFFFKSGCAGCSSGRDSDCKDEKSDALARYNRFLETFSRRHTTTILRRHITRHTRKRSTASYFPLQTVRYTHPPMVVRSERRPSAFTLVDRSQLGIERLQMHLESRYRMQQRQHALRERLELRNQKPWWGVWSTWSACGRTCGSGVQFQERYCLSSGQQGGEADCGELSKRYRICNRNPCSTSMPTFRQLQCAQHAAKRVRGKFYNWKPYGHPVDEVASNKPCQLVCVSSKNEVQMNTVSMDGTECHRGWDPGRCVEGGCQLIGCDGRINSKKLRNKCGKCDGDGESCIIRENVFTQHLHQKGEYEILRIPTGAYDILVDERRSSPATFRIKNVNGILLFDGARDQGGQGGGWPRNQVIACVEFRYRRPSTTSSDAGYEYILATDPIEEPIIIFLAANEPGYVSIHYEFKVPTGAVLQNTTSAPVTTTISDTAGGTEAPIGIGNVTENTTQRRFENPEENISTPINSPSKLNLTQSVISKPRLIVPVIQKAAEQPKIVLLPQRGDRTKDKQPKYPNGGSIPTFSHYEYVEEKDAVVLLNQEEDFLRLREDEPVMKQGVIDTGEYDDATKTAVNESQTVSGNSSLFSKPIVSTNLIRIAALKDTAYIPPILLLEKTNKSVTDKANVYTVERQVPVGNETTDSDAVDEDDIPEDGGEDYVLAPGVDIPIPVRYGSRQTGRYDTRLSPDYSWRNNGHAPCSSTCTTGLQDSYAVCQRWRDGIRVDDSYCDPRTRPEPVRRSCINQPCQPRWEVTPWSECSMSCGAGVRMRTVRCWQMIGHGFDSTLYVEMCNGIAGEKPEETKPCRMLDKCGPQWETSDWSSCPAPCGKTGVKWRSVRCSAGPDQPCSSRPRPITEEQCRGLPCLLKWAATEWGQCSGVCGGGRKTRKVTCISPEGFARSDEQCDPVLKPATSHPCGDANCRPEWIAQDWGECLVKCGSGTRKRKVMCTEIVNGQVHNYDDDTPCDSTPKPSESETCQMGDCDPVWFTTSWSKCSVTCGSGHRVREVKCYLKSMPVDGCDSTQKPLNKEDCTMPACPQIRPEQCKDRTTVNCSLVKKARLCVHWYYRKACCGSCPSGRK